MGISRFLNKTLAASIAVGLSLSSCESYLDVNDNPNYPTEADVTTLLPSACASTIAITGLYGTLIGTMWLQFTTQGNTTNQYNTLCNYSLTTSSYTSFWRNAYVNTLPDLKDIITTAEDEEAWDYWVIAKILMAYNFHILTDLYEDIPFTEALDNETYPEPNYDDSETVVYPGILEMLDDAISRIDDAEANPSTGIDSYDMFLDGDMDSWRKFANNLKLKLMIRDFDTYEEDIEELLDERDFLEEDCAFTDFEDATNKGNPLYEYNIRQLNTQENIRACHTLLEFLLAYDDPRVENIYEETSASGSDDSMPVYEGLPCGTKPNTSVIALSQSSRYMQAYSDPVYLMNEAEIHFLEAEAYARLGNTSMAKTQYDAGVEAAFNRWESTSGLGTDFVSSGGAYEFDSSSEDTMLECILTQKWISYARANCLDGVFDRNRTGIPSISSANTVRVSNAPGERTLTSGYELGTLVAPGSTVLQPLEYPRRLLVPDISSNYNSNAPTTKSLQEPMWWQVEQGK